MKKITYLAGSLGLILGLLSCAPRMGGGAVDSYTSASPTKQTLTGSGLTAARTRLTEISGDLATLAETRAPGYQPRNGVPANIMSVNPDGSVGLSTIADWKLTQDSPDTLTVVLTHGQNALNLKEKGKGASLLVRDGGVSYLLHLRVRETVEKPFDQAAFAAGEFPLMYSGAEGRLASYTIHLDVLSIETTNMLMFDFPSG
jgi:hypothetical protein